MIRPKYREGALLFVFEHFLYRVMGKNGRFGLVGKGMKQYRL